MTPESHTIYSLSLFFSLAALLIWSRRRQPVASREGEPIRRTSRKPYRWSTRPVNSAPVQLTLSAKPVLPR